jgi:hypothetical protein
MLDATASGGVRPRLLLDSWQPDYEGSVQVESPLEESSVEVDATVESVLWEPVCKPPIESLPSIYFLDGTRRTDARVLAMEGGKVIHGLFGSAAIGAVLVRDDEAVFKDCSVTRVLILGLGLSKTVTAEIGSSELRFDGIGSVATTPAEVTIALQETMRREEAKFAEHLLNQDGLVFMDGPLAYLTTAESTIGIIKRISQPYLDAARFGLLRELRIGARTPLFAIRDRSKDRYAWYLRIGVGTRIEHSLAGIIRLEVRAAVGIDRARELANASCGILPRFASSPIRDPRAPQNLVPVGALEQELRRRMGDAVLIHRAIQRKIAEGVSL